jgi:hypothetical protein
MATQTGINNDYFTSFDGEKFEEVARVKVPAIALAYSPIINGQACVGGTTYYRLKQTDFHGKTSYSEIRMVILKEVPFGLKIYPDPVDGGEFTTEVQVDNNLIAMQVYNTAGQVVLSATAEGPITKWNPG